MKEKMMRLGHSFGLALRIIFALTVIAVIIWKFRELQNLDVRALIASAGSLPETLATILGIYAVKGLTLIVPASLVYIAVGMSIKLVWALAVNVTGIIVEVSVTYLMGVILGGPFVTKKLKNIKAGKKIFDIYEKHNKASIFIMRIAGLPIDFCSLFFGAMRVRYLPYLGMSLAGILPRVILFTVLGDRVYDLVPMKYVVMVGAAAVVAALVIWIVRYALKSIRSEEEFGKPAYTPLCEQKRKVIIDTDIGPDCDDAGALALAFNYIKKYDIELLGIFNCTSNIFGNAAIKAIAEYYGYDEIPVGCHKGSAVLPDSSKYSKQITAKYCKYEASACAAPDAVELYQKLLSECEDGSVTVITLGMFTNLAGVLNENANLFNKKVHSVVSMAGAFPGGKEFNITTDPISAAAVMEKYRNLLVFSGHETGRDILTGFSSPDESNPVYDCYKLHCGGEEPPYLNPSYDLTAVQYAFEGNTVFYGLSKPVAVTVDMSGSFQAKKDKFSQKHYIIKKGDDDEIAAYLNDILSSKAALPAPIEKDGSGQ